MAAYAALVSLVQLLHPDEYPLHFRIPEIESLYIKATSLQSSLGKIFPIPKTIRNSVNELDVKIRDEIYKAQNLIESFVLNQYSTFRKDLLELLSQIDPLEETAKSIAASIHEDPQTSSMYVQPSESAPITRSTRIVGQEEDFDQITRKLVEENPKLRILSIVGLPGIGKTTLAKSIYEDPNTQSCFPTRAWVTVSQDCQVSEIFTKLLSTMESKGQKPGGHKLVEGRTTIDKLSHQLHQSLFDKKYLVVVDDMWDEEIWDKVRQYLPDENNGSRIILTTRLATMAEYANKNGFRHDMKPLTDENSWILLREKAFGGGPGLDYLEESGTAIACNCKGLPLSLTVIGGLLFQESKTFEYWNIIKEDTYAAAASYLEILSLSYIHLPCRLKGCFLYMGAFPEDSEILVNKIINLWIAEGFLKSTLSQNVEQVANHYLEDLINRNLISTRKWTSNGHTKAFGMHDSLRDLAVNKCRNENFFHAINKCIKKENLPQGTCDQRRLSVHKNLLMCDKDVYESAKSIALTRTLLYPGPHHHHPLPFSLTFDLLRVLDALSIYFIRFPNEIIRLIHLRFLSLTYNGKLPSSLSKLRKLQILIVHRNPKIIFIGSSYLPAEIWNMPELRHLEFMESDLPHPSECTVISTKKSILLRHLQSLSKVNATSCTRDFLRNMPNLKKLGMWVEKPGDIGFYLDELEKLEDFKFIVLNPIPNDSVNFKPRFFFPEMLKKLTLSGCGIPWEDMTVIGQLPFLQVLKLRELAFQGKIWAPEEGEFVALKYLLLEYLDLKYWGAEHCHFPSLESLILRHCYKLKEIDPDIRTIGGLKLIEMVDCSPLAVEWAKYVREVNTNKNLKVRIYTSWE